MSGIVPMRLDPAVRATRRVRSDSTADRASVVSSPSAGSKSTHRTTAAARSAACTHGRTFASWSSRVTTTSSPGAQVLASALETSYVRAVIDRPWTMPRGCAPRRSAIAVRKSTTHDSARRSAAVTVPRLAMAAVRVAVTAAATTSGTCEPPGPSKWAAPCARAGKWARTALTS